MTDTIGRDLIAHILRGRYANGLARIADQILRDAFAEVAAKVRDSTLDRGRRDTLLVLMGRIRARLGDAYRSTRDRIEADLRGFVELEAAVTQQDIALRLNAAGSEIDVVSGLSRTSLRSIAALPIEGHTLGEWYKGQAATMTEATRRQIQVGMSLGENPDAIAHRIVNTDAASPALERKARRDARAVARTAVTAVQSHAANETYIANADIVEGYRLVPIWDSRTSPICRAIDPAKVWHFDDPRRLSPPLHIGCRTNTTPAIDWRAVGAPAPDEPIPTMRDYGAWLKEQGPSAQDAILGPSRAAAWRAGSITLQDLIGADLRPLTLEQLRAKYGEAFKMERAVAA